MAALARAKGCQGSPEHDLDGAQMTGMAWLCDGGDSDLTMVEESKVTLQNTKSSSHVEMLGLEGAMQRCGNVVENGVTYLIRR